MTLNDLSNELKKMYFESSEGETVTMIHLFGIKYAKEIVELGISKAEIAKAADIPKSYGVEINKGIKLSKYVEVIV